MSNRVTKNNAKNFTPSSVKSHKVFTVKIYYFGGSQQKTGGGGGSAFSFNWFSLIFEGYCNANLFGIENSYGKIFSLQRYVNYVLCYIYLNVLTARKTYIGSNEFNHH